MKKVYGILILCSLAITSFAQTQIVAHRGFWNAENNAKNSITALFNAQQIQVYGSEFDVLITKDNILVVNHDAKIDGVMVEDATFEQFKDHRLKNGEPLPTLEEYFQQGLLDKETKMVLELKPHTTPEIETKAVLAIAEMIKKFDNLPQIDFISFSLHACKELALQFPTSEVAYLNGDIAPSELKKMNISGIDYHHSVIRKNPEWVEEAHKLGMKVNVWTVNEEKDIREMLSLGVDFITTDFPLRAKKVLQEQP